MCAGSRNNVWNQEPLQMRVSTDSQPSGNTMNGFLMPDNTSGAQGTQPRGRRTTRWLAAAVASA